MLGFEKALNWKKLKRSCDSLKEFLASCLVFLQFGLFLIYLLSKGSFLYGFVPIAVLAVAFALKNIFKIKRPSIKYKRPWRFVKSLDKALPHSYSFPSGHASFSFAVAFVVLFLEEFKASLYSISFFVLASIISFARVWQNYHRPRDILGGLGLAFVLVLLLFINV